MVFESLVVELMNKYLGAYIENLDSSQLKLSIWGGNVVLTNLHLKGDALKDLDLPISVISGFIGKLTLKIPWKNLYKDAVEATLDSLYILAVPNTTVDFDANKEAEKAEKERQAELQEIEDQVLKNSDKLEKPKQDTFAEKLATQVIKNIQVHVKNVHIRFEDDVTLPSQPFAVGVTLAGLDLQTSNENWIPTLLDESVKIIYKMVNLDSLAVYWNCKPNILFSRASHETQMAEFQRTVAKGEFSPDDYNYIIKPLIMDIRLRLNPHPENDISNPKIILKVFLQELGVTLSRVQYHSLMELVESLDRMSVNAPFRKFRPRVSVKGHAKAYWKYAYRCVLEAGVRRKLQMFSWAHIKQHRQKVRTYKTLYKEKLKQKNPPKDLVQRLVKMENNLDIYNIILARQNAELELVRDGIRIKSKKSIHQKEVKESTPWYGGWFGGSKPKEEKGKRETSEVMNDEEKKLLYDAIGYSEGESPKEANYPKNYVEISVAVVLKLVSFQLTDGENLNGKSVLLALLKHISTDFQTLPTLKGICVDTKMHDFQVSGLERNGVIPQLVVADFLGDKNPQAGTGYKNLLALKFETNPKDETCDQRVNVSARPLKIVYDAKTVNSLASFFKTSPDIQLQQVRTVASSAYEDIKIQTTAGLKHAIATRKITDISVNVMSSYVVVPKNGLFSEGCEVIVLDLGAVTLDSVNEGLTPASTSDNLEDMRQSAYDKFQLEVNDVQLLIAGHQEDWVSSRSLNSSPLHVLEPLSVKLNMQKCMIEDDSTMPKFKLEGKLSVLSVRISDNKIKNAINLVQSIPLPPPDPVPAAPLVKYEALDFQNGLKKSDIQTMSDVFQSQVSSTNNSSDEFFTAESDLSDFDEKTTQKLGLKKLHKKSMSEMKQLTDMYATFQIGKISVVFSRYVDTCEKSMLDLSVENFGVSSILRTWDTSLNAHLGSVKVLYQGLDDSSVYILDTPNYRQGATDLLKLKVLLAKPTAPDFSSTYHNIEKSLDIRFSIFQINVNSKAIMDIKEFADKLMPQETTEIVNREASISPEDGVSRSATLTPTSNVSTVGHSPPSSSYTSGSSTETPRSKKKKRKKRKKKKKLTPTVNAEVTELKLTAVLEKFSIILSDDTQTIAHAAIKGIESTITLDSHMTKVDAKLHDLAIIDPTERSLYSDIITAVGDDVLNASITVFKNGTSGYEYVNMNAVDTSIIVRFGALRAVFLKRFIDSMLGFAENFQETKLVAQEARDVASKSVMQLAERNPRIKLDILLMAPKVIIPQGSKSRDVLLMDLGTVQVSNTFRIIGSEDSESPAVSDDMKIIVREMKLSLCHLNVLHESVSEYRIIEPFLVNISLQRNLAALWFHDVPDVTITGMMSDVSIKFSGFDLESMMRIVNANLLESSAVRPTEFEPPNKTAKTQPTKDDSILTLARPSAINKDALNLSFNLSKIRLNLYTDKNRTSPLAEFAMKDIPFIFRLGSDKALHFKVSLHDITLDDQRLDYQDGITRHIKRKHSVARGQNVCAIEANARRYADGSMDIDLTVGKMEIILCLKFILEIVDVFISALSSEEDLPSDSVVKETTKDTLSSSASAESISSDSFIIEQKPHEIQPTSTTSKKMKITFELHQPDIVLVTDIRSNHCQALVLNMRALAEVNINCTGEEQNVSAAITGFQLVNCPFSVIEDIASEHKKIISPCDIKFQAKVSPVLQDITIDLTRIRIAATPLVINTIAEAVDVLSTDSKPTLCKSDEKRVDADIWETKHVAEMQYWFTENPEEELTAKPTTAILPIQSTLRREVDMSQIMKLNVPSIQILLESGQGNHTIPLLVTEMKARGEIMDWSGGNMEGNMRLAFGVVYFNESLSVWEPLVEPVETDPGNLNSTYEPWTVEAIIQQSLADAAAERTLSSSSLDELPPLLSIDIKSPKLLHTTITNDTLKVLHSLGTAFTEAALMKRNKSDSKIGDEPDGALEFLSADVRIDNMLDRPINIALGKALVIVTRNGPDKNATGEYTLGYKDYLAVNTAGAEDLDIWELLSNQANSYDNKTSTITVSLPGGTNSIQFDISKTGEKTYVLSRKGDRVPVTCIVTSKSGSRNVTLRSPLVLQNHLSNILQVFDKDDIAISSVKRGDSFPLPSKFLSGEKLFVKPHEMDVYKAEIEWTSVRLGSDFHIKSVVDCPSNSGSNHDVSLNVEVMCKRINSTNKDDNCYTICVYPVALFKNYLPFNIEYTVVNGGKESTGRQLSPGTGVQLLNAALKKSVLKAKVQYLGNEWTGQIMLEPGLSELSVWTFKCKNDVMVLGKQITYNDGYMKISLYSPYWMINNTGLTLEYKASDDNIMQHQSDDQDFVLFSFTSKSFVSKNKLQVRACNSNYCEGFSIDTVGSSGTISCKAKQFKYKIGTQIHLTSFGLTKVVTFSSYYTITNQTLIDLEIFEAENTAEPITVAAKSTCKFWPENELDQLKVGVKGEKGQSASIRYSALDSGILVKVGNTLLFVDVSVTESSVTISIKDYYVGSSAVMLINDTTMLNIEVGQSGVETSKVVLKAGEVKHLLWAEPTGKREVSWKISNVESKEVTNDIMVELNREIKVKTSGKEMTLYYAVFLDGLQRVLLFTENVQSAKAVELGMATERANCDLYVELQGLSCSITDTKARREVMYMAITSSGLVWEEKPKKRWKPLPLKYGSKLEEKFQENLSSSHFLKFENYEFDLAKMKVNKPHSGDLRRSFSPGILLHYTLCDHQIQMHAKVNRIQIDNQLPDAVFPVVLSPMPMPKTVAIDSSPKPFLELSILQRKSEHLTFPHIKYFQVLMQELSVKADMGFISALLRVFGRGDIETSEDAELKNFRNDISYTKKGSGTEESSINDPGLTFFDNLHLSPIKVHLSFSLQNTLGGENADTNVVVLPFNALAAVLKSIGVTISDIDDVIFKLGFFERDYQFFSSAQLTNAITRHYAGQAIKQLYVLVLGLDVIGNPYGLVMGIAEGVQDLFYEPYQGMIQGPGEFAEGLALGAKSLLGHTVGGAAAAVSRVTGALGKGVAALTMDDEFTKKRQIQMNKPTDVKESLARGGKGFVMGFVGGVTGVVTKPMEGAKKEGAAGFFKGVGKGLIGIIARPASGVIDLASNTFEGISKLADMSEDVRRMRPARWIHEDTGILQPYKLRKAQGKAILLEVEKGKFADNARYIDHVPMDKNKKSFLLLTDEMILEAHTGDILGQWNSDWNFSYEEIEEEPHLTKDGIKLIGAKTKKLFGAKTHQRTVTFFEPAYEKHALERIKKNWSDYRHGRKIGSFKESKSRMGHHFSFGSRKGKKHAQS